MDPSSKLSVKFKGFHWMIVFFSIVITVFAWWFSKNQVEEKIQFQNEFSKINDKIEELIADKENNEDAETDIDNARTELDNKRSELKKIIKKIRRLSGSRSITSKLSKTRAITLR